MRVIKPSATLMEHNTTPYEFIEKVGRTCYKSEDKITEGSAERFVKSLVERQHMAMLEHETIYMELTERHMLSLLADLAVESELLKFFNVTTFHDCVLSGSFRSFYDLLSKGYESLALDYIKKALQDNYPLVFDVFDEPKIGKRRHNKKYGVILYSRQEFIDRFINTPEVLFKHLTHTFKFVCDRGVSHEFVRHRVASFAQESTRYCNYAKDKFGSEITVIQPLFWYPDGKIHYDYEWFTSCFNAEKSYFKLLEMGATPQEARTVLPNSLKTELIITTTEEEWQHIVNLRYLGTTGAPHPQMKEVMSLAVKELLKQSGGRVRYEAD